MVNYLTRSVASATYQTIANMVNYVDITTAQSVAGVKTFSVFPRVTGTPTLTNE